MDYRASVVVLYSGRLSRNSCSTTYFIIKNDPYFVLTKKKLSKSPQAKKLSLNFPEICPIHIGSFEEMREKSC
jgi:hypothetical protein